MPLQATPSVACLLIIDTDNMYSILHQDQPVQAIVRLFYLLPVRPVRYAGEYTPISAHVPSRQDLKHPNCFEIQWQSSPSGKGSAPFPKGCSNPYFRSRLGHQLWQASLTTPSWPWP